MNRPRSTIVTEGPQRAGARAFFHAMGLSDEQIHRPWVGIASTWNEATPCNIALDRQAKAAKQGVQNAGGTEMSAEFRGRRSDVVQPLCLNDRRNLWVTSSRATLARS